ncbi:MAG: carboxypeptidase-like regulatory domain-containing protein [Bacteroidales bacterium]|jgi:hypothetical protein|nr:carboxypeptidase-like regulatory domain-containing protein [Bacteroidales bacterium]
MIHRITLFLLFVFIALDGISQIDEKKVSIHCSDASFIAFIEELEVQTGLNVFYRKEWIEDVRVTLNVDSEDALETVKRSLRGYGLYAEYVKGRGIYLLTSRTLNKDIQQSIGGLEIQDNANDKGSGSNQDADSYLQGTRPEQIMRTIVVGERNNRISRGYARIMGSITNMDTGDPIAGATMIIMETGRGAVSDKDGILNIAVEPGNYTAQFNFIGKEQINCNLEVLSNGNFLLQMSSALIAIDEVQIQAKQYRDINSTDIGMVRLTMKSLKQIPVFMGENDVIKIAKLLPGITSAGEASAGVNVRGGSVDQNVFYIDRIPIYNTAHLFGFFSAFNSEIIRDYSIYKGNVPVNYGGRLSSVFNIVTRKGNNKKFTGQGSISPVSGKLTFEGPIIKEKASFIISGRSSYSDWILDKMQDPLLRESEAGFNDLSGSINFTINEKNSLSALYYQSYDNFKYSDLSNYNYKNRGGSVNWKSQLSTALTMDITTALSNYQFNYSDIKEFSKAYEHGYSLQHNEITAAFKWIPDMKHKLEFGTNAIYYKLNRGIVSPYNMFSIRETIDLGVEQAYEGSVFLSDNFNVNNWLSIYGGLRYSYYTNLGPKTIQTYEEGFPREEDYVSGTFSFKKNESVAFYSGPEFRSAINMKSGPNTTFKLAFNQMRQYLMMLSNTVTISPTDQWKLTDNYIKPPLSYQYSGGVYHIIPKYGLTASMELYYKSSSNIVDYKDGADFISSPHIETQILQGNQSAYGAEFLLDKGSGRLNGWISYTLSRSIMHVEGPTLAESINNGNSYPSNFDRPHVLNLVGNYKINRRFTLASNLVYMSGRPVTYPSSLYYIDDVAYIDYYARNQFRVPVIKTSSSG